MSPLTDRQLATLVELLDAREQALLAKLHEHVAQLRDSSSPGSNAPAGDSVDQAAIELVRQHESAAARRYVQTLREIAEALARVENNVAGVCVNCTDEIGFQRLLAQPTATRCVCCQALHERTHLPAYDLAA